MSHLDLSDLLVRRMADRDHVPEEVAVYVGAENEYHSEVRCEQCKAAWPCAVRLAIRDLSKGYPEKYR